MTALGKQGLHIIRQAAQTAAELEHQMVEIGQATEAAATPHDDGLNVSTKLGALVAAKRKRKPSKASAPSVPAVPGLPVFDREVLRLKLDAASVRPTPGSSELLSRPLSCELVFGYTEGGKLSNEAEVHDLTAMAPIHLKERE